MLSRLSKKLDSMKDYLTHPFGWVSIISWFVPFDKTHLCPNSLTTPPRLASLLLFISCPASPSCPSYECLSKVLLLSFWRSFAMSLMFFGSFLCYRVEGIEVANFIERSGAAGESPLTNGIGFVTKSSVVHCYHHAHHCSWFPNLHHCLFCLAFSYGLSKILFYAVWEKGRERRKLIFNRERERTEENGK